MKKLELHNTLNEEQLLAHNERARLKRELRDEIVDSVDCIINILDITGDKTKFKTLLKKTGDEYIERLSNLKV